MLSDQKSEQIQSINVEPHFLDFQNQTTMPVLYQMCDLFVLPSKGPEETWGLAINEAMASRKAILASDKCGGAIDLVMDGVNGYIFESENEQELLIRLKNLTANKANLKNMGSKSYEFIQKFSFTKICEGIEDVVLSKI